MRPRAPIVSEYEGELDVLDFLLTLGEVEEGFQISYTTDYNGLVNREVGTARTIEEAKSTINEMMELMSGLPEFDKDIFWFPPEPTENDYVMYALWHLKITKEESID